MRVTMYLASTRPLAMLELKPCLIIPPKTVQNAAIYTL